MIRPITKSDRNTYLIFAKAYFSSEAVNHTIPHSHFVKTFEQLMESDTYAQGYILESDGKPVGYALTAKTYSQEAGGMVIWIEELFVLPAFRGKGLGTEFLTYLKQHAEPNTARFRLEVTPENQSAIHFYERMGFRSLPYSQMIQEWHP